MGVQAEVYKLYGKAYGWYSIIALCFFWASEQSTNILTSWWLSQWATAQIIYTVEQALGKQHLLKCYTALNSGVPVAVEDSYTAQRDVGLTWSYPSCVLCYTALKVWSAFTN